MPIPKPGKDTSIWNSYRPISLLCPAAKVLESLILFTAVKIPCLEEITAYRKDNFFFFFCPKVFSQVVQSEHTPSQDPSENTHWGLTANAGPMPKDIRSLSRHLSIINQAYRQSSRESIQQKQYPQGLGRYILGTTEGITTDDIQGSWEIINYAAPVWSTIIRDKTTETTNIHRTRLWGLPQAVTRCPVSTTCM